MQQILVDEKRWVSQRRFLHALNYCMLLPGPEAQQLVTYLGWLLHGWRGGLVAGTLFVLPGFIAILGLSILYVLYRRLATVDALLFGLKAAVLAIVIDALIRIGRRSLRNVWMIGVAGAAFVAIFFFDVPFPLIVLGAAAAGWLIESARHGTFAPVDVAEADEVRRPIDDRTTRSRPGVGRLLRVVAIWLALWSIPFILIALTLGADHAVFVEATFFSKVAVVSFGGAYAILAYVAQEAVETYAWLRPGEMLDGLGMAETTPGPLIMVLQFVGFLGAYRNPGPLEPLTAGVLGAVVTVWVTFVPCFLWIFAGAPYVEWLRGRRGPSAALAAITAAVVGVILNLAVWFAAHVLFAEVDERHAMGMRLLVPELASLDAWALALSLGAFVALFLLRWGMIRTLLGTALLGMVVDLTIRG